MSQYRTITCDGCGSNAEASPNYPPSFLRLSATGRLTGDTIASKIGVVDICSAGCAAAAVADLFVRVRA